MRVNAAVGHMTIFLLAVFIISALSCPISVSGFNTTHGQISLKIPWGMEPAEGYVLSKYSDYRSFDREYTRNDTLYVWAWSYRIDPYNLMENYCQLKLGEYEYTFPISYHPNMTRQYSYVGSFELSALQKVGDWEVHIFLKSKPKPPPASYEPKDVIHVSDVPPPLVTYTLSVSSTPIADIPFTLDNQQYTTHWSGSLTEGIHTLRMPSSVTVGSDTYNFDRWSDGDPNPEKTVDLQADTSLVATYKLLTPPVPADLWPAVMPYVVPMGLLALFGVTAYIVVRGRRRRVREEIKETEYRITLEVARLEAVLQELDSLLERGVISRERYEAMRREIEDELTKIRGLKS
ncbi:MAG: SHOCT domain-containing protein [Candidatus Bathyarchaeia archaeon]